MHHVIATASYKFHKCRTSDNVLAPSEKQITKQLIIQEMVDHKYARHFHELEKSLNSHLLPVLNI